MFAWSRTRRYYALAILTAALTLSYVDRYLLAVMVEPIKADLKLSDSMIGVLTGFAFSAFYAAFGLPVARLADRGWRRPVIIGSVAVWSVMTALSGAAQSAWQMAVARFGVGAGEAGVFPASQSLIVDIFPAASRSTALAIFATGGSGGILLAFALGSQIEAAIGWRLTFVAMLLPGLLLTALLFTIGEPARRRAAQPELRQHVGIVRQLWNNPVLRHLPFAQSALVILIFGQTQWLPAFVERSFGVSRTELGAMLGLSQGVASLVGIVAGGLIADRLARRDPRWPVRVAFGCVLLSIGPAMALYLSDSAGSVYIWSALTALLMSAPAGPVSAYLHSHVDPDQRATAAATVMMVAAFVGLGGGPLLIGGLSDLLAPTLGAESLRYALLVVVLGSALWAMTHLWRLDASSRSAA